MSDVSNKTDATQDSTLQLNLDQLCAAAWLMLSTILATLFQDGPGIFKVVAAFAAAGGGFLLLKGFDVTSRWCKFLPSTILGYTVVVLVGWSTNYHPLIAPLAMAIFGWVISLLLVMGLYELLNRQGSKETVKSALDQPAGIQLEPARSRPYDGGRDQ